MFSKLCSLLFPQADIYAYEPNPSAFEWLTRNAEGTRIQAVPCAVGQHDGLVKLDTSCDSTIGRVTKDGNLQVECIAASAVASGRPIDFLKMDCEGSEWAILQDTTLLNRAKEACLEFHLVDTHSLIEKADHRVVRISNTKENGKFGVIHSMHK
jgi:FkbM family methyltransferase